MTPPPDSEDTRKALELADRKERTPADTAFLKQFFADHLQPRAGEDPAAHAARLPTPQLFRLYRQLRTDFHIAPPETYALTPADPPAPVAATMEDHESRAARVLAERAPAVSSHSDFVDMDEVYTPAGHPEGRLPPVEREDESPPVVEEPPAAPRRGHADTIAKPAGKGRGLARKAAGFVRDHTLAVGLLGAAVAIASGSYGTMYFINREAHRAAEPIRQMQQRTGKTADGIATDSGGAPTDGKDRPASPRPAPDVKSR
jgi:hypothetical protein